MSQGTIPWKLVQNKIVRYPGGREIDRFRGVEPPMDDGRPEAWVGSVTPVSNAVAKGDPNDGCAKCILPSGEELYLFDAIAKDPIAALGQAHVARYGSHPNFLVKLLDAQNQLGLQTHPDRPYAKKHWNSDFGKAECWYIVGLRKDTPEAPYVLLGFQKDANVETFGDFFDAQDIASMEKCCHKIPVEVGDVFTVAAGVPHAVGAGCFLIEVQEPSDITVGATKLKSGSEQEQAIHRDRLLHAYRYDGASYEENLQKYRIAPKELHRDAKGYEEILIGQEQTPYFSMTRITASAPYAAMETGRCAVLIVLSGKGELRFDGGVMPVEQADEVFVPAGVSKICYVPSGDQPLVVVACHPPLANA